LGVLWKKGEELEWVGGGRSEVVQGRRVEKTIEEEEEGCEVVSVGQVREDAQLA
jgi:hypothetical protein